tara:strand:+ start:3585 stop:3959 length:375 start_codon:yes stop_codon:yes gene_type:complete
MKHISTTCKLKHLMEQVYYTAGRLIFKLPKGKVPFLVYNVLHSPYPHRSWEQGNEMLVSCFYLSCTGVAVTFNGEQQVVPLKLEGLNLVEYLDNEEDELIDEWEIKHLGCRNYPECDDAGCGEW